MRLLIPLFLSILPVFGGSEKEPLKGVDVTLISENATIAAGGIFSVALRIHHHPGFHTYWKNPGVAGVPTQIAWTLPDGFSAGEIQWPFPEKTLMAIHPVHGYERDVMLVVDIKAPEKIQTSSVRIQASASWMACADGCYPGKTALELTLPVAADATKSAAVVEQFTQARNEIPQPLETWSAELISAVDAPEIRLRLKPESSGGAPPPGDVYFFSSDGQISSDQPQRVEIAPDGAFQIIASRSPYGPKGKKSLPGVLLSAAPLRKDGARFARLEP